MYAGAYYLLNEFLPTSTRCWGIVREIVLNFKNLWFSGLLYDYAEDMFHCC